MDSPFSSDRQRGLLWIAAAFVLLLVAPGCVMVSAAEREFLADPAMTFGSEGASEAHEEYVFENREGSFGGGRTRGGGCGCN